MIEALAAVLKAKTGLPRQKPTLIALADVAQLQDGEWVTFASIKWMAEVSERGESTVRADLQQLEAAGWIVKRRVVELRSGRSDPYCEYALNRERLEGACNPFLMRGKSRRSVRPARPAPDPSGDQLRRPAPDPGGDQAERPAPDFSTTSAGLQQDLRQTSAAHIDERDLELDIEPCAHAVREACDVAEAEAQHGLAGEWVAIPAELRRDLLEAAHEAEGWAAAYVDPCAINLSSGVLHPATGIARGQLDRFSVRRVLRLAGFELGEALGLGPLQRAKAATAAAEVRA